MTSHMVAMHSSARARGWVRRKTLPYSSTASVANTASVPRLRMSGSPLTMGMLRGVSDACRAMTHQGPAHSMLSCRGKRSSHACSVVYSDLVSRRDGNFLM